MLFAVAMSITMTLMSEAQETTNEVRRPMFLPPPLSDDWTKWIVGEWEGTGETDTGAGKGIERIELALNGQFLISRGRARITEMTPEQVNYLKKHMHASDAEIERFKTEGFQGMEIYTIDQKTGEVIGYLFDSLRCMATGRGKREGNKETMDWVWATGHKSTRITEKVGEDRIVVIQRTRMPDGSVMEEKGQKIRRKPQPVSEKR